MRLISVLLLLVFFSCKTKQINHLVDVDGSYHYFNKEDKEIDQRIEAMILPYRTELAKEMDVVLIQNEKALKKDRPNCNLGQWIADMIKEHTNEEGYKIDFAVQNQGGLRVNEVGTGPLTVGNIFEVMPFENMVVVLETDGSVLQQFCSHIAESGGWPISDGLSFKITPEATATDILINGNPLDLSKNYRYAVPDYIANGGSDCAFFKGIEQETTGRLIRDLMLEITKKKGASGEALNVSKVNRIK